MCVPSSKYLKMAPPTPRDDPAILREWKGLERKYLKEGLVRQQALKKIAAEYDCGLTTVYTRLTQKDQARRRKTDLHYKRVIRHLPYYLQKAYSGQQRTYTLNTLSRRLEEIVGIRISPSVIEKIVRGLQEQTGYPPLVNVATNTGKVSGYYLGRMFYRRYPARPIKPKV